MHSLRLEVGARKLDFRTTQKKISIYDHIRQEFIDSMPRLEHEERLVKVDTRCCKQMSSQNHVVQVHPLQPLGSLAFSAVQSMQSTMGL